MYKIILLVILATCYILHSTSSAGAQTISNKDYIIKMEGINTVSGVTSDQKDNLESSIGKSGSVVSEGVNFQVRSGFENAASTLPFSASLSSDLIDFGSLSPTNPIVRTVDLSIYSLSTSGYSVVASEDHLLQTNPDASGANIPDTTCDNGDCSEKNASAWVNTLTYGFGYRCDNLTGADCDSSFLQPDSYKHFPNISNTQFPQSVMVGIGWKNKDIRLSYKVNIAGNQAQGIYTNVVTYIAVPNF